MRKRFAIPLAIIGVPVLIGLIPPEPPADITPPTPAVSHVEALARARALETGPPPALFEGCSSVLLDHGVRTPRAVVLLHGLTNCPIQFDSLGRELFRLGDNVIIPRLPQHGLADRMTEDLRSMDDAELQRVAAEAVAIAHGLGDTVIVAGLSLGGTLAAWCGQTLPSVDRAVAIAPALGPFGTYEFFTPLITRGFLWTPNQFWWWDPAKKENLPGPAQTYPRFSTHALGEMYWLGEQVLWAAWFKPPAARNLALVTNQSDLAVNRSLIRRLERRWKGRGATVISYEFPRDVNVQHDLIDPLQVGARPDAVYPVLIDLIHGGNGSLAQTRP